jgi:hypothetical protein
MRQGAMVAVVSQWAAVALTAARRDGGCSEPVGGSGPNCGKARWWL